MICCVHRPLNTVDMRYVKFAGRWVVRCLFFPRALALIFATLGPSCHMSLPLLKHRRLANAWGFPATPGGRISKAWLLSGSGCDASNVWKDVRMSVLDGSMLAKVLSWLTYQIYDLLSLVCGAWEAPLPLFAGAFTTCGLAESAELSSSNVVTMCFWLHFLLMKPRASWGWMLWV